MISNRLTFELLVGGGVVVKPCSITAILRVHESEMLSQLRLGGWRLGLILNFSSGLFHEGIRRVVLGWNV